MTKKEKAAESAHAKSEKVQPKEAAESSQDLKQKADPAKSATERSNKSQQKAVDVKKDTEKATGAVFATGKRRKAIARASIKPGTGLITLNAKSVEALDNKTVKLLINEPLMLIGDAWKKFNIKVTTRGGGIVGQAQAARQAIAKALSETLGAEAKKLFMEYDRNMLVYDPRRTETHKSPRSSQGPRRAKQKSKR
jgi:small subunit ribosomal protein S9